ncbi:MAG: lipocalin family protein [Chitinophagaceae bacterium]
MKKIVFLIAILVFGNTVMAQPIIGKWQKISEANVFQGEKFDSHKALLSTKPCAAAFFYEINADGTFRLNTSKSSCDEGYKKIQQKLYSKTNWQLKGNKLTISSIKNFVVGQTYEVIIKGNTMTWIGTDGQGTLTYTKLTN